MIGEAASELTTRPDNGCYIRGLFLEGARWNMDMFELAESRPKELYTDMPVMWLIPTANRKQPESGMYVCPVYKTLTRAGGCVEGRRKKIMLTHIHMGENEVLIVIVVTLFVCLIL